MPNLELSMEELKALHEALETYMQLETREAGEAGRDLTKDTTFQLNKGVYERLHRTMAWGGGGHLQRGPSTARP